MLRTKLYYLKSKIFQIRISYKNFIENIHFNPTISCEYFPSPIESKMGTQ